MGEREQPYRAEGLRTMNVVFRVDSSVHIGSGHFMRCIALADELRKRGASVSFICRELGRNLIDLAENEGYGVYRLPYDGRLSKPKMALNSYSHWLGVSLETDAWQTGRVLAASRHTIDWLIVDHYALDKRWESRMRQYVKKIMVIDDLANRLHDCDVLLDQNYHENGELRYRGLVPEGCRVLLGPKFSLLRSEFKKARKNLRMRDGRVKRILIFFGASDLTNETTKAINAILMLDRTDIQVKVVLGDANPYVEQVKKLCSSMLNVKLLHGTTNMAKVMADSDLAIGAGGITTWERCCLGLPSIIIAVAYNQEVIGREAHKCGAGIFLGASAYVTSNDIANELRKLISQPKILVKLRNKMLSLVDGNGTERILEALLGLNKRM